MNIRTDLAMESAANLENTKVPVGLPDGIVKNEFEKNGFHITEIEVVNSNGAKELGKPIGRYVTIRSEGLSAKSEDFNGRSMAIAEQIRRLSGATSSSKVLVVGLGNRDITPDNLGSLVAGQILCTRHIKKLAVDFDTSDLCDVSCIAPGVLGQTGIEAADVASSLLGRVEPDVIIAVDALACSELDNLGTTVQLSDTGISPGSGVANTRGELSKRTLGVPCIAIGVPTVVDMSTICYQLTGQEISVANATDMMVTPRNIDTLVERSAKLIAMGINLAFQTNMTVEEINLLC